MRRITIQFPGRLSALEFPVDGRHICSDFVIMVNGDEATSRVYCVYLEMKQPCEVSMVGTYFDKLRRTVHGWKFTERIFEPHTLRESEATINIGREG